MSPLAFYTSITTISPSLYPIPLSQLHYTPPSHFFSPHHLYIPSLLSLSRISLPQVYYGYSHFQMLLLEAAFTNQNKTAATSSISYFFHCFLLMRSPFILIIFIFYEYLIFHPSLSPVFLIDWSYSIPYLNNTSSIIPLSNDLSSPSFLISNGLSVFSITPSTLRHQLKLVFQ